MARIFLQTGDSSITISGPSTILPLSSKITGNFKIILGTSTATADLSKIGKAAASTVVEIHRPSTDFHQVISKGYVYVLAGASTDLKSAVVKLPIAKKADSTAVKLHFNDYKTDVAVTKDGALDHAPDGTTAVTLAASTTSIDEGQTVTYTATLASPAPVGGVKVPYTLSGISAADFDLTSLTGTIAIAAGKTTGTLVLNAAADVTTEGTETLSVALQAAPRVELGATTTASTTIVDTSKTTTVALTSSATTVDESAPNNVVTYTATLSNPATSALSIPYTLGGTAVAADYSTASTGTINIGVGETTGTLVLTTVADTTTEDAETVSVALQVAPGIELGTTITASTTIVDTSKTPVIIPAATLAASTATVNEGSLVTYTATLSSPATSDLSIPYTLGGTAVAADYSTTSTGTINIATGATTGTLVLNTVADATTEGAETLSIALQVAPGIELGTTITASTTIVDTSKTPVIIPTATLAASTATVNEGSLVTYTATLSSPATSDLSIPYTLGGTAVAADYSTTSTGTINIATGATTGTLVLTTVADATTEGAETVSVTLGAATGVTLGSVATQSTTITDTSVTNPFTTIQLANSPVTATTAAEAFVFDFQMLGGRPTKAATSGEVTITGFDVTKDKLVFNDVGTGTVYTEAQFMALPGVVLAQNPFDATNTTIYVDPLGSVLGGVTIVGIQDKALASIVLETTA
jgi:limonene-1,2-epoxide hydrolase